MFTLGDFVIVAAAIPSMISVVWNLGDLVLNASRQVGQFSDAVANLREKQERLRGGEAALAHDQTYSITFDKITFQYPGTQKPVFSNFSFAVKSGERVGVVGPSGVGKSTLVKLLLRQYNAQAGAVAVGGTSVDRLSLEAFNTLISYVPQDTSLFHRTLFENIAYADPRASKEAVLKASREAHAEEFINALPDKYDTKVGERGVKLSGGQRQRIALARAILKNAPILILDEATSSLDSESESAIQETLSLLFKNHTVVAIAHRLSTLRAMDRIVVINEGEIVESGTPQALLENKDGIFKKMWEHQKNGFV
jgi:ATP-binding cassette subfamily B protein